MPATNTATTKTTKINPKNVPAAPAQKVDIDALTTDDVVVKPAEQATAAKRDYAEYRREYTAKLKQLGPARSLAIAARRLSKRIGREISAVTKWGEEGATVLAHLKLANAQLLGAAEACDEFNADWRPPAGANGASAKTPAVDIAVGSVVDVRETARKHYEDVIEDAGDFEGLKVLAVLKSKKLKCMPKSGGLALIFPRGHVAPATEKTETKTPAA